jgi:hypothetical protein
LKVCEKGITRSAGNAHGVGENQVPAGKITAHRLPWTQKHRSCLSGARADSEIYPLAIAGGAILNSAALSAIRLPLNLLESSGRSNRARKVRAIFRNTLAPDSAQTQDEANEREQAEYGPLFCDPHKNREEVDG